VTSIVAKAKRFLTGWAVAQVMSAGLLFYGSGLVLALFMEHEHAVIPFILFTVFVPAGFCALTISWWLCRRGTGVPLLEINLIFGLVIFMPVYFEIVSLLIYKPRPFILTDVAEDLFYYYLMLPITVASMGAYTATLGGLLLAIVSTVGTGAMIRRRGSRRTFSSPS
jgi:hypothetical protein